jgi:hypothetical protein
MSDPPRYIVAKYVSDLQRMEPKNIGIIVCAEGRLSARFLAEKPEKPGEVDGRNVPGFVTSTAVYKQWVEFWRGELNKRAKVASLNWLEDLKRSSRGNFLLVDGGLLLESVKPNRLSVLTNDLFSRLVEPISAEESKDPTLDQVADHLIRELRLDQNQNFRTKYELACNVGSNVTERFEFSHAYKNGVLKRLYQRVPLARKRGPLRRTIHDSAWMFEKVVAEGIIKRDQAVALVYATDEHRRDPEVSWSFDVLRSVARVVNLSDQIEAISAFIVDP